MHRHELTDEQWRKLSSLLHRHPLREDRAQLPGHRAPRLCSAMAQGGRL